MIFISGLVLLEHDFYCRTLHMFGEITGDTRELDIYH